jgi:hypothetical protein
MMVVLIAGTPMMKRQDQQIAALVISPRKS